jgi:hypothetical protein
METTPPRFEAMTLGGLLDRMFSIYGSNFTLILGIVAVAYVPLYALQIGLHAAALQVGSDTAALLIAGSNLIVLIPMLLISYPLSEGAAMFAISERYLGRNITIGEAYRQGRRRWGTIINAQLTIGVRVFLGLLLCFVPGIIWTMMYALTVPVVVLEGTKAVDGLRRSRRLTEGQRWKIFCLMFLIGAITSLVVIGVSVLGALVLSDESAAGSLLQEVLVSVGQLFVAPLGTIAPILLYYDCRIRKEGFDLEMLNQALARQSGTPPAAPLPAGA